MGQVDEDSVSSEQGTASDGRGEERAPDRETGEGRRVPLHLRVSPLHLPSSYLLT